MAKMAKWIALLLSVPLVLSHIERPLSLTEIQPLEYQQIMERFYDEADDVLTMVAKVKLKAAPYTQAVVDCHETHCSIYCSKQLRGLAADMKTLLAVRTSFEESVSQSVSDLLNGVDMTTLDLEIWEYIVAHPVAKIQQVGRVLICMCKNVQRRLKKLKPPFSIMECIPEDDTLLHEPDVGTFIV